MHVRQPAHAVHTEIPQKLDAYWTLLFGMLPRYFNGEGQLSLSPEDAEGYPERISVSGPSDEPGSEIP